MSDDNPSPNPGVPRSLLWLCVAFLPSVLGIICFQIKSLGPGMLPLLIFANFFCSVAGGAGVASGIKSEGARVALAVLLMPVFFILNAFIVLFIGCSGVGRIAP